jgi:uncharacterized membrane protein YkoI
MRTRIAITTVLTSIAVGAAAVPAGASAAASRQPAAAHAAATRAEAKAAARKAVGGGRVTKVEHFNSGHVRWEIDVRRNGRSWEVKLSRTLRVLSKDLRHVGGNDDGPNHH